VGDVTIDPSTGPRLRHPIWTLRAIAAAVSPGRRTRVIVCLCLLVPVLAACGDDDSDPSEPTVVATAGAPAPTEVVPQATEIPAPTQVVAADPVWTTSIEPGTNRPLAEVEDEFDAAAPVIYAAISVAAAPAGALLVANWTYNDTPIQGMDATVQLPEVRFEPIWLEFHLERQAGDEWPDGEYRIVLREGDRIVSEGAVEVMPPERAPR
jgi:hypothetical protein